jgi:hypothetical protein
MLSIVEEPAEEIALPSIPAEDEEPEDGIAPELADESDVPVNCNFRRRGHRVTGLGAVQCHGRRSLLRR